MLSDLGFFVRKYWYYGVIVFLISMQVGSANKASDNLRSMKSLFKQTLEQELDKSYEQNFREGCEVGTTTTVIVMALSNGINLVPDQKKIANHCYNMFIQHKSQTRTFKLPNYIPKGQKDDSI